MRLRSVVVSVLLLVAPWLAFAADAEKKVIEEVQVVGGSTITPDTVEYYLGVSKGDPYDPAAIAKNFHRFWDSGLVEDLKVEAEDISPGKVKLIVTVKERPTVTAFEFKGNKKLSATTIREKLDTAGVTLKRNVPLKSSDLQKLKQAIEDVYAKEGYSSAVVTPIVENVEVNAKKVVFQIDEGSKVRIGKISFTGNKVFSDARLRRAMKKIKERSLFHLFGKKLIWNKEAWGEDSENLKKFYMNHGYKDVIIGEPTAELVARKPRGKTQAEKKFATSITIPVEEGRQFRLGELSIVGNTVFPTDKLRKLYYEVKPGKVYNYSKIDAGNEAVRTAYQARGYIYAYTNQVTKDVKGKADVTDVEIQVYEGDRYRLGRLEFTGNTKTQEKVLRREFRLLEGSWMDMSTFRRSVFKVNQLGYFKLTEDPLDFKFDDVNKLVNVTVKGTEIGRTDIQFGAGYSELDHFFAQVVFNTRNFLGRGETLGVSLSSGARADSYSLSFSEPYFLDRRMVVGASIYKQRMDLVDYIRNSTGGSLLWGLGVGDFGQFTLTYGYENVNAKYNVTRYVLAGQEPASPHRPPLPPPYSGISVPDLFFADYKGITSSFTPAYGYDSRDDPFDPSQGLTYFGRLRYAGGLLGGDFSYWRPEAGMSFYHPIGRRYIVAFNVEGGYIRPFSGTAIPVYDRYRLGGERSLRGFPYYGVLPRVPNGDYFRDQYGTPLGGDRYLQLNMEYQIKVGGPLKLIFFSDIGNTWAEQQGWDLGVLRYSAGAELRIFLPIFQAPLRFIYGINLKPYKGVPSLGIADEKRADFTFSIGTTF
ncbi:MAG: outer membrane protein assembly factor BamA [Acidobacteriota bacterium]